MTIGEKIKKIRLAKNLSQKQVAQLAGMSEPTIRNYELGNRTPSQNQIEKIANALDISPFAISNPDLNSYIGIMHALFYLEENYGLVPQEIDGQIYLNFENSNSGASEYLAHWNTEYQKTKKATKEEIEQIQSYYNEWKHTFPKLEAKKTKEKLKNLRKKSENT